VLYIHQQLKAVLVGVYFLARAACIPCFDGVNLSFSLKWACYGKQFYGQNRLNCPIPFIPRPDIQKRIGMSQF